MRTIRSLYDRLPVEIRTRLRASVPDALLRGYAHRNSDVYLISYPKCGRTWLRLMMGRALAIHFGLEESEEILFLRSNRRFHPQAPRINITHEDRPMLKAPEELETDKTRFTDKKVIFLARDPRDVVISSYFEMKNRGQMFGKNPYTNRQAVFEGSPSEFIERRIGGFDTILAYYNIWARNRHIPKDFLLVRYEDLKANPAAELRRVLEFIDIQGVADAVIAQAVAYASFDHMREMETEGRFASGILNPGDATNAESFKTRKGKIKGYIDYLSPAEVEMLDTKLSENLSDYFGYTTVETPNPLMKIGHGI